MNKMGDKWIKGVVKPSERGRLHKQLGIPKDDRIPKSLVNRIVAAEVGSSVKNPTKTGNRNVKVTRLLKQRANFAKNVGYKKR